jgi:4'-phosphopantetheinyl transferase
MQLDDKEVHVWKVGLLVPDREVLERAALLSVDERERSSRFRFGCHARRFIVTRATLRAILAKYVGGPAAEIRFHYGKSGKPRLHTPEGNIRFNLSHSEEYAVFAVSRGREVGVDLEWMKEDKDLERLSQRFFSPHEQGAIAQLPAARQTHAFYRCWTCKEAYIKATGDGLALPLNQFDVCADPLQPANLIATRPDASEAIRWSLRDLAVPDGFAGAIAGEGRNWDVVVKGD